MSDIEDLLRRAVRDATPAVPLAPWGETGAPRAAWHRRPRWVAPRARARHPRARARRQRSCSAGRRTARARRRLRALAAAVVDWPSNQILHVRMLMMSNFAQPDELEESWQLTSPPYTRRVVNGSPRRHRRAAVESAIGLERNSVRPSTGARTRSCRRAACGADWRPTGVEQPTRDEIAAGSATAMRRASARATWTGTTWSASRPSAHDAPVRRRRDVSCRCIDQSFGYGVGHERRGYDRHYTWELLPVTPANRALLDVAAQHPDAPLVTLPGPSVACARDRARRPLKPPVTPGA